MTSHSPSILETANLKVQEIFSLKQKLPFANNKKAKKTYKKVQRFPSVIKKMGLPEIN